MDFENLSGDAALAYPIIIDLIKTIHEEFRTKKPIGGLYKISPSGQHSMTLEFHANNKFFEIVYEIEL